MLEASNAIRYAHMVDSSNFDVDMSYHLAMTVVQTILLFFVVVISIFKPWGRTRYKL